MAATKSDYIGIELTSKEVDHLVAVLAIDVETLEDIMSRSKINAKDPELLADHKQGLNLINILRAAQVQSTTK